MNTNTISYFHNRIFNWQRDIAGQPVATTPEHHSPEFYKKQLGFVRSEWFDEYVPHAAVLSTVNDSLWTLSDNIREPYPAGTLTGIGEPHELIASEQKHRIAIADDIADTAYTLFGLLTAAGIPFNHNQLPFMNPDGSRLLTGHGAAEWTVSSNIVALADCPAEKREQIIISTIYTLNRLAKRYGVAFWDALRIVSDSNDTKLWTQDEAERVIADPKFSGYKVTRVPERNFRCMRVVNADGKLMKSPSYSKPDLLPSLELTWW